MINKKQEETIKLVIIGLWEIIIKILRENKLLKIDSAIYKRVIMFEDELYNLKIN